MAQQQKMGANPMNPMMMPGMNMGGQQADPNQKMKEMFKNQAESLSLVEHKFAFENCPESATKRLKEFLNE